MNKKHKDYVTHIDNDENVGSFKPEKKTLEELLANAKKYEDKKFINVLYKKSNEWRSKLTSGQIHAIRKYTKNSLDSGYVPMKRRFYYQLNNYLSGITNNLYNSKEFYEEYINNISSAIKKFKIKESFLSFRGSDEDEFPEEVGKIVLRKRFVSASIDIKQAFDKKYKIVIVSEPYTRCAFLGNLSRVPEQKEVLFDIGVEYEIINKEGNTTYVRALK